MERDIKKKILEDLMCYMDKQVGGKFKKPEMEPEPEMEEDYDDSGSELSVEMSATGEEADDLKSELERMLKSRGVKKSM